MFGTDFSAILRDPAQPLGAGALVTARQRRRVWLANGRRHGPITRLIAPWDIGEHTSPFVLLHYAEAERRSRPLFGSHPPSGITTLTVVLNGELSLEDETGKQAEAVAGGFAWMKAGSVVWHEGGESVREPLRVFHLWVEQPLGARGEFAAMSEYIAPHEVAEEGPVRVLLGELGRARSRVRHAPPDLNVFHVRLKDRQNFHYTPPAGHDVTWLAVDSGSLQLREGERVLWEQVAVFGGSAGEIEVQAEGETSFLLGSARSRTQE